MLLDFENKWKPGTLLRVKFLNGSQRLHDRVMERAKLWEEHCSIKFEVDDAEDAEVRVQFDSSKTDTKIGSDALTFSPNEPTMEYDFNVSENAPDDDMNRIVTHEFGHALGLIHEHFHPASAIKWNRQAAINFYGNRYGFSPHDCDLNLFREFIRNRLQFSAFDRNSIMIYPIDSSCTTDGTSFGRMTELSDEDKRFIGLCYPGQEKNPVPIKHGETLNGNLTVPEQEDIYSFSITDNGIRATAETSGNTNLVISFYTLETDGARKGLIRYITPFDTWQGGSGNDAKIETDLPIGEYFIRVRHYDPDGIGSYSLGLKLI